MHLVRCHPKTQESVLLSQAAASYFNVLALALMVDHTIGQNLPLPHEINNWWNQAKSWVLPRRDLLALDLDGDGVVISAMRKWLF